MSATSFESSDVLSSSPDSDSFDFGSSPTGFAIDGESLAFGSSSTDNTYAVGSPPDWSDSENESLILGSSPEVVNNPDTFSLGSSTHNADESKVHSSDSCSDSLEPLYHGAEISLCGALCAIMQFCSANHLSYTAIDQLLKLFLLIIPCPNTLPNSVYKFKKFFEKFQQPYNLQYLCSYCQLLHQNCTCSNPNCGHLAHISIEKPLKTVLSSEFLCF